MASLLSICNFYINIKYQFYFFTPSISIDLYQINLQKYNKLKSFNSQLIFVFINISLLYFVRECLILQQKVLICGEVIYNHQQLTHSNKPLQLLKHSSIKTLPNAQPQVPIKMINPSTQFILNSNRTLIQAKALSTIHIQKLSSMVIQSDFTSFIFFFLSYILISLNFQLKMTQIVNFYIHFFGGFSISLLI